MFQNAPNTLRVLVDSAVVKLGSTGTSGLDAVKVGSVLNDIDIPQTKNLHFYSFIEILL
jgi:hypothetical protein